jgi:hypothetical protein
MSGLRTAVLCCLLLVPSGLASGQTPNEAVSAARMLEIRSYNLVPGSRDQYHQLLLREALPLPLLRRHKVDVIAYGP